MSNQLNTIVVLGDDAIAAMTAAVLKKNIANIDVILLGGFKFSGGAITASSLISSFYTLTGLTPGELLKNTDSLYSLGAQYDACTADQRPFFHGFTEYDDTVGFVAFDQYAPVLNNAKIMQPLDTYSLSALIARSGKFSSHIQLGEELISIPSGMNVGLESLHRYLLAYGKHLGVNIQEATIQFFALDTSSRLSDIELSTGTTINADFVIDCSGANDALPSFLAERNFDVWDVFLPFRYRAELSFTGTHTLAAFSGVSHHSSGWMKKFSLRTSGRIHMALDSEERCVSVLDRYPEAFAKMPINYPNFGSYKENWVSNYLAIGKAAGNPDDVVVSEFEQALSSLSTLLRLWPDKEFSSELIAEYNRLDRLSVESIRDYHCLHYFLLSGERLEEVENLPPELFNEVELYRQVGRFPVREHSVIPHHQWASLMMGLGFWPERTLNLLNGQNMQSYLQSLNRYRTAMMDEIANMPSYSAYLEQVLHSSNK